MRARDGPRDPPAARGHARGDGGLLRERGLAWREDATNESLDFARNRVRHELLPALRGLHPAAEANILRTLEILRDEAEVLDDARRPAEADLDALGALPPALARLAISARWPAAPIGAPSGRRSSPSADMAPRRSISAAACAPSPSTGG